jgi:HPt (histidine-containing phosphotransfer) domain-containing protein
MSQLPSSRQAPTPDAAAARGATPTLLDEASLERLRELDPSGSNHVVERVMRAFEASLQRLLAVAAQSSAQDELAAIRHVVHTLKSSSASVGALELSRRCGDIENRLRVSQTDDLESLLQGMQAEGQRVLVAVRAMLAR